MEWVEFGILRSKGFHEERNIQGDQAHDATPQVRKPKVSAWRGESPLGELPPPIPKGTLFISNPHGLLFPDTHAKNPRGNQGPI